MPSRDDAARAVKQIAEGTWAPGGDGLEAIIQRFARPVQLVQDNTFAPPADIFPDSEEIKRRLTAAKTALDAAIPAVGRIDLRNHIFFFQRRAGRRTPHRGARRRNWHRQEASDPHAHERRNL